MLSAGDVLLVHCLFTDPQKDKFALCVCPTRRWFFLINSEPWEKKADAQVEIQSFELAALSQNSWVDTSRIVAFQQSELLPALRDRNRYKGQLSNAVRLRIKTVVHGHGYLPAGQKAVAEENL